MDYVFYQEYWWFLVSLLGGLLVFLLFVQGGNALIFSLGKNETERKMIVNSTGRKWEFTFTTLVTFGGAFFASFPLFYSTSFGGAYWLWMLILFSFIIQAVAYKYRSKEGNIYGTKTYDVLLCINGFAGPLLLGVAVGTMFFGAEFTVEKANILNPQSSAISQWSSTHGLEAILSLKNLSLGITVLMLARVLASLYFINNINDEAFCKAQRKELLFNSLLFVPFFLLFVYLLLTANGVSTTGDRMVWVKYKYFHNLISTWWIPAFFLIGTVLVLLGIGKTILSDRFNKGIWISGIGTICVVLSLFWMAGFNDTASLADMQSSLTIRNSSSSEFTLTAMSIVSLLIPFVLAYIIYAWRALDRVKITAEEIENTAKEDKY